MNIRNFPFSQPHSHHHHNNTLSHHHLSTSTTTTTNPTATTSQQSSHSSAHHHSNTNMIFNFSNPSRGISSHQQQQQQQTSHHQHQHQQFKEQPAIASSLPTIIVKSEHTFQQPQSPHHINTHHQNQNLLSPPQQSTSIQHSYLIPSSSTSSLHDHQQFMNNKYQEVYQQQQQQQQQQYHHQTNHHQTQANTSSLQQQQQQSNEHYYSRLNNSDSLSSEDLNQHHNQPPQPQQQHTSIQQQQQQQQQIISNQISLPDHSNSIPQMAGVYFPRNNPFTAMGINGFPSVDQNQINTRLTTSSPQWTSQRFGQYGNLIPSHPAAPMYYLPSTQPNGPDLSMYTHPTESTPQHELSGERMAHLQALYGSPSLIGIPSSFQHSFEGQIKIDLYHKPRGSKGTWMVINSGDQIRVTEGKGKRLKMIVHSEQELTKVGLQVALLDLQNTNPSHRRGSSSSSTSSSPSINSTTPNSPTSTTTTTTNNQNINNNNTTHSAVGQSTQSSASSPSPTTTSSNSLHTLQGLNSSTTASPSPSSFSLSSPTQSPTQSPSQSNISPLIINTPSSTVSPFSVSISITPPSQNPAPILPLGHSSQLPPPDSQGLSVESVRVYRYPSMAQIPLSAIELELKLAKLSKRLCIVMAAQSKDGNNYEGRSVDFFAHNNGKHNANAMNRQNNARRGPYSSPTISGEVGSLSPNQQHALNHSTGSSPIDRKKKASAPSRSASTGSLTTMAANTNNVGLGASRQSRSGSPPNNNNNNANNTNNNNNAPPLPSIPLPPSIVDFSQSNQWQAFQQQHLPPTQLEPAWHENIPLYLHQAPPPPHPTFNDDKHT